MPTPSRRPRNRRDGFTLLELLIVIVVIVILAGLLLPAINGAIRRAREASVNAEINQMAQALADFKNKYGDYPPSRIILSETGDYSSFVSNTNPVDPTASADITFAQLAQRSILALRKFWPRVPMSTLGPPPTISLTNAPINYYDFNGNGSPDAPYLLDGRACLVFFLGGVPVQTTNSSGAVLFGASGFGRNPTNPFANNIQGSPMYSNNRSQPLFEFKGERLLLLPGATSNSPPLNGGIPAYYDPNSPTTTYSPPTPPLPSSTPNPSFYAYFSAYGGAYDPNDVNILEADLNVTSAPAIFLTFKVNFPVISTSGSAAQFTTSPGPNPYTVSQTGGPTAVTYQNAQSFQIISTGADGFYGAGGPYASTSNQPLPPDTNYTPGPPPVMPTDTNVRLTEGDNLTNFHNGRLQ